MANTNEENKENKLDDLAKLTGISNESKKETKKESKKEKTEEPSALDGYRHVPNEQLPFNGVLYPENWKFFYRSPLVDEVVNFSTVADDDNAKQVATIEALIKKCWIILDAETQHNISTNELNDGDKLFFFLKLREFYLNDSPIKYNVYNPTYLKSVEIELRAENLVYPTLKQKMIDKYDGRLISISTSNNPNEDIKFLTPTFEISRKILLYIQKAQKNIREKKVSEKDNLDKTLILFLPYLFETGKEKMEQLETKLKKILKNKELFNRYMEIIGKLSLTNKEQITYMYGSDGENEEEFTVDMQLPSFKHMFIKQDSSNETDDDI